MRRRSACGRLDWVTAILEQNVVLAGPPPSQPLPGGELSALQLLAASAPG
jgi:hypothetical protein